jgi:hypothetical protein
MPVHTKRLRLPKSVFQNRPAFFRDVEFRAVQSDEELLESARLVYKEYRACEYIPKNLQERHLSVHQAIPTTVTFVAIHKQKEILGTVTLIEDSPIGVPMESIYADEIHTLRQRGIRFAEIGLLALDEERLAEPQFAMSRFQRLLFVFHVYRAMFDYFRSRSNLDELVACFHPKHEFMYSFLGFLPLGGLKSYGAVQGSPAVARHLNKKDHELKALTDSHFQDLMFYWEKAAQSIKPLRLSSELVHRLFVQKTDSFSRATPDQIRSIRDIYKEEEIRTSGTSSYSVLFDLLTRTPEARAENEPTSSSIEVQDFRVALENAGFKRGDQFVFLTASRLDQEWRIAKQAARLIGGNAVGVGPDVPFEKVASVFKQISPIGIIAENRAVMDQIPEDLLDSLKFVFLLDPLKGGDDKAALFEILLSPPVCVPSRIHFWENLVRP